MRFKIRIREIQIVGYNLRWCEHPFVNERPGRKRANVEQRRLLEALVCAKQVARLLSNQIKFAFKCERIEPFGCRDKHLLNLGFCKPSGRTDVREVSGLRYIAPTDERLAFGGDEAIQCLLAIFPFYYILRQKDVADGVLASRWELNPEIGFANSPNKFVGHANQNACAIASVRFASTCASVIHIHQNRIGINNNLVAWLPFDVGDETNTTGILFQLWIV